MSARNCPEHSACEGKIIQRIAQKILVSDYPRDIDREGITVWKFLATDIQSVESIGAVCAVFKEVFFCLGEFFAAFVFSEAVATAAHAGCLNGESVWQNEVSTRDSIKTF